MRVVPLAGTRIEICKYEYENHITGVVPLAGTRIEIAAVADLKTVLSGRPPRGDED